MLHFGGGKFDKSNPTTDGYYGASTSSTSNRDMGDAYRSRKQELEERILQKKLAKAEKLKRKEDQVETFETMDESFAELAGLLQFRDKERERVEKSEKRKRGLLDVEEMEMDAWDKEMKVRLRERERTLWVLFALVSFCSELTRAYRSIILLSRNTYLNEKSRQQTAQKHPKKLPKKKLRGYTSWKRAV